MTIPVYTLPMSTYYQLARLAGTKLVVLLCNGNASWTDATAPGDFDACWVSMLATELAATNGYTSRGDYGTLGNPVWSAADRQMKITPPNPTITITASGGSLSYDGYVWVLTNQLVPNKEITAIASSVFTCTAHGLAANDRVMVTIDIPGTQPGGVSATTLYYARTITTNTFQISTTASDAGLVTVTNNGSLGTNPLRLRYGNYTVVDSRVKLPATVSDGQIVIPIYISASNDDLEPGIAET